MSRKLTITFLVPSVYLTGGIKLILQYGNELIKRGHRINVIFPWRINPKFGFFSKIERSLWFIKYWGEKLTKKDYIPWFNFKGTVLKISDFRDKYLPQSDVLVATSWDTTKWVAEAKKEKGKKFYFIQQYEIWGDKKSVDESFKLPLKKIVIASWLKKLLQEKFNEDSFLVVNGVDTKMFYPVKVKRGKKEFRVGMLYHPSLWKGTKYGLDAFRLARKKIPNLKLVLISAYPKQKDVPLGTEFHFLVPPEKLRYVYSSCDLWISPSLSEGCQAPPMEAMACKVPVIATNVGGIPDYAIVGKTVIITRLKSASDLAKKIWFLYQNSQKRQEIAKQGFSYIRKKFKIEKSVDKIEKIFYEQLS